MKIMVCGKGGTGKTSLTVLISRILSKRFRVFIIDSDESNVLLPDLMGVSPPKPLVQYIGGKMEEEEMEKNLPDIARALAKAKEGIKIDLLPSEYVATSKEGVSLVVIGKVREYGEGCACPFNILTRILLGNLCLGENEIALIDTDAGVEHVGRRLEEVCDGLLVIVDPTAEALELALTLKNVAQSLNKKIWFIANKVTEDIRTMLMNEAEKLGLRIDGVVRFDKELYVSCLKRETLKSNLAMSDLKHIVGKIWNI